MTGRWMQVFVLSVVVSAGCTKDNPHACAEGDPCTDPARPFCDLDGLVAGVPGACIAVSCTPGDFAACDANRAIQCNPTGNNYDTVLCERGCDPASDGCRLCSPNETACTNGVTATCNASGAVVSMEPCALGCFESEPRCRSVDPSNGLAIYLDAAGDAPDIELPDGTLIDATAGTITPPASTPLTVETFLVGAPPDGVPIRVFVVGSLTAGDLVFAAPAQQVAVPAVAVVAAREIRITGVVDLSTSRIPPGSVIAGPCVGVAGAGIFEPPDRNYVTGSGGGGGATPGAAGGYIDFLGTPAGTGLAGAAFPNDDVIPLRGGCAGGGAFEEGAGAGGGAIQLVSNTGITIASEATIVTNGQGGDRTQDVIGGGGSGGGILLEAPVVEIEALARVLANGGGGLAGDYQSYAPASDTSVQPPDAMCIAPSSNCGTGGAGGAGTAPPRRGGILTYTNAPMVLQTAGGGGGAVGHIRINTATGAFQLSTDAILSPAASTGTVGTR